MKICACMFYDDNIKDYAEINYKINKRYCDKNNIDIILSNTKIYENRHPAWERLPLLLKHIKNYDYLIWIDSDAFFYIDSSNILDIINNNLNYNFIFSKDLGNYNINTGFLIIKKSRYSIDFLKFWAYDEESYINNPYPVVWDQGVLLDIYNKNIHDIQNNSIRVDYGILQHFSYDELLYFSKKPYILHLAGKSREDRINCSLNYYNNILNIDHTILNNKTYTWQDNSITFLENGNIDAFGNGIYIFLENNKIKAYFGGNIHNITFNNNYTEFTSIRNDDNDNIKGILYNIKLNINNNRLNNKTYTWQNSSITFLENGNMNAFGNGKYVYLENKKINAYFGGNSHDIIFNNNYTQFTSTRKNDGEIVKGSLI